MTVRTIAIAGLALLLITSCQRSENRKMDRRVSPAELVGVWKMTMESTRDLAAVGATSTIDPQQHTISIRPDGTCHFHTFPSALATDGATNPILDRECRWAIREVVDRQALLLDLVGEPAFVVRYDLFEQDGTPVLWQHADDPDAWRYVEYTRQ